MVPSPSSPRSSRERTNQQPEGKHNMSEETIVRSSTSVRSSRRPTGGIARLHPLGTAPSAPVRVDPRRQEVWELLGLLPEEGPQGVRREGREDAPGGGPQGGGPAAPRVGAAPGDGQVPQAL